MRGAPNVALLHGGTPHGAERIAACWTEAHEVALSALKSH